MFAHDIATRRPRAWVDSLFVDHSVLRIAWTNWAAVEPGVLYRCNHPTPARLRAAKRRFGIATLINLRGQRQCGSDALSRTEARRLGMVHIDAPLESRGAPHRERILRLAGIFAGMRAPALMHCKSGADRTGLAAGLYILMQGGSSTQALKQLTFWHGHLNGSRTGILDAFFYRYRAEGEGKKAFLDWVRDDYDEHELRANFQASGGLSSFLTDHVLRRE